MQRLLPPFKLGLGGKLGNGEQYYSWVALFDALNSIQHCLLSKNLEGPINVAAPENVTNLVFTNTLGHVLSRPTMFAVPASALRVIFGEVADTMLASARLDSAKLVSSGFEFQFPDIKSALKTTIHA